MHRSSTTTSSSCIIHHDHHHYSQAINGRAILINGGGGGTEVETELVTTTAQPKQGVLGVLKDTNFLNSVEHFYVII